MIRNFCGKILTEGGKLVPLIIPHAETGGTGLMNPTVLIDEDIYVNVRHTNYVLYHAEKNQRFASVYGPLVYMNPENDQQLKTNNFFCHINPDMSIRSQTKIDTKKFDHQLVYAAEFHGLEDGRLVRWDDKLFICGVRRDTEVSGVGRIEMSELVVENEGQITELNRYRIEPPKEGSHCEKNWMPILDMPYHFVKWTNPLEIIKVNPEEGKSETVILQHTIVGGTGDMRGGSQVVPIGGYRVCLVHEVNLRRSLLDKKDAKYVHRFVIWDKEWNLVKLSEPFSFLNGEIEFCCGLGVYEGNVIVTFGFQDNAAYLLSIPMNSFESFTELEYSIKGKENIFSPVYYVSAEKCTDRQQKMNLQKDELNLERVVAVITTEVMDNSIQARGKFVHTLDKPTLYAVTSHLRAIKKWLKESKDEYAIFLEDDVNLLTMKYWSFTWDEFIKALPKDWDCIQMSCVRKDLSEVKLRKRKWDDWSATAYLLKREYARKIINQYYRDETFTLEINDIQPLIENIIYLLGNTYMIPLFTENIAFKSTSHGNVLEQEYKPNHYESALFTETWWKENGLATNLKEIL